MSRGLGRQQRTILAALQRLEQEHGPGWRSPAEVIALAAPPRAPAPAPVGLAIDPEERLIRSQLEGCRQLVALGHREYEAGVMLAEARLAQLAQDRKRRTVRAQQAATRAPNQVRLVPRGGEAGNPSRVLALLERRGLVERAAHCGPGSAVRLAPG